MQKVPSAKITCLNGAPPKCTFIIWLALHDRLATCGYLEKIGVQVDHDCCLCGESEETMEHLFFECKFSKEVWSQVTTWCGFRRGAMQWSAEKVFLYSQCTTNNISQRLYRCMVTVLVYQIWLMRNYKRMQNQPALVENVVKQFKFLIELCERFEVEICSG